MGVYGLPWTNLSHRYRYCGTCGTFSKFNFSGKEHEFIYCQNLIINGVMEPLGAGASAEGPKARRCEFGKKSLSEYSNQFSNTFS